MKELKEKLVNLTYDSLSLRAELRSKIINDIDKLSEFQIESLIESLENEANEWKKEEWKEHIKQLEENKTKQNSLITIIKK